MRARGRCDAMAAGAQPLRRCRPRRRLLCRGYKNGPCGPLCDLLLLGSSHLRCHFGGEVVLTSSRCLRRPRTSRTLCTVALAALSICSIVCLSFFTNGWFSSDTSFRYFCTEPSTHLGDDFGGGLPSARPFGVFLASAERPNALSRSARPALASDDSETGFIAAMCIATSLPTCSSAPSNSTSTPMRVPCRYDASLSVGFETLEAADRHVFADLADQRRTHCVDRLAVERQRRQRGDVGRVVLGDQLGGRACRSARKSSFLATKSVSQFTSTSAPTLPSMYAATTPSAVTRDAALLPCCRA